jgi:hypothetical protein
MPGLVPGIHVLAAQKTWMAGTSPAMTNMSAEVFRALDAAQRAAVRSVNNAASRTGHDDLSSSFRGMSRVAAT